jgi:hypothetical protein
MLPYTLRASGPRICATLIASVATAVTFAGTIDLAWDPVPGAAGYRVLYGTASGVYDRVKDVGNATLVRLENLKDCTTHYAAVQAYNGPNTGPPSDELEGWPRPEFLALYPPEARQGESLALEIQGTNFHPLADLLGFETDLYGESLARVDNFNVVSCTRITAKISLAPGQRGMRAAPVGWQSLMGAANPDLGFGADPALLSVLFEPYRADINRDERGTLDRVDGSDLTWLAFAYGSLEGEPTYNPDADLDGNGLIDGEDLSLLAPFFASCWNGTGWDADACE